LAQSQERFQLNPDPTKSLQPWFISARQRFSGMFKFLQFRFYDLWQKQFSSEAK
jgi:hypothetical protein